MNDEIKKSAQQQPEELISCEVCLKSVPRSASKSIENDDYVAYFCGLDCYQAWVAKDSKNQANKVTGK